MKRKLSEFAYGFVLTHELVHTHGLVPAGGETPDGMGYPLFLQFKSSDYLKRRNAGESKLVGLPYFRFSLHRRSQSNQQALLLALEGQGHLVFYATPKIHEAVNLNRAFFDREVVRGSLFVAPREIGELPDNEMYEVVFSGRHEEVYLCPDGRRLVEARGGESLLKAWPRLLASCSPWRLDDDFYRGLAREMLTLTSPNRRIFDEFARGTFEMAPATFADYLAKTLFDCELLIIPSDCANRSES
jgi:hypothetical protein